MQLNHFHPSEFMVNGEAVFEKMDKTFLLRLDECREQADLPFEITSSWRSIEHNRKVGGSTRSYHLKGRAVDVRCTDSAQRARIIHAALSVGLTVGIMPAALHLDDRDGPPIVFHYYEKYPAGPSDKD
jgi:uncharacterized protein YcbK (DUF882 family)